MPRTNRPDRPVAERNLPTVTAGSRLLTAYDAGMALQVCEAIAEGKTLTNALKEPGTPSRPTWYRWLMIYPELDKAYEAARKISAEAQEDQLLMLTEHLLDNKTEMSKLLITRYQVAMAQLRWSAARRDPGRFGERKETNVVVPIQINTTLDLGQATGQSDTFANVYSISATVQDTSDDTASSLRPTMDEFPAGEDLPGDPFSLPTAEQVKHPGVLAHKSSAATKSRSPAAHPGKSPRAIKAQMTRLANAAAKKEKN